MVSNPSNNIKYDSIDEVIIRLLGLQSGLELDYQTYFEIIKKKLAIARLAGKELPREEDELLREELKRVRKIKDTGTRFKVRKKKTKVSKTPDTPATPLNQKLIAPSGGVIMRSPKEMLTPNQIIPAKIDDDKKEGKKGYSELTPIQETLASILDLLKNKFKLTQKVSDQERRDKEFEKRSKRESLLEGLKNGIGGVVNATKKLLSPLDSLFERIKRFIFFVLLGKAFTKFMEWMNNAENRKKFDSFVEFLTDHWPAIAGLYILFGTSYGRFVRSILKIAARMIVALAVNIPRILTFIKKNKKLAFLALAAAPLVTREISNALNTKEDKDTESIGTEVENAKNIEIKPSPSSDISKLVPGGSGGSDAQKVPTLNFGGLVPREQKVPKFNLGGLLPKFDLGGMNKSSKSGISPAMNLSAGIPITGAGQDDTLIAAKTGEAVLTKKDQKDIKQKYVHKDSGRPLDIPKYLAGRKPGTVSADKIKFRGGFFEGGMIQRFNSGGMVGNVSNPQYSLPPSWEQRRNEGREKIDTNPQYLLPPSWEQRRQNLRQNPKMGNIPSYQKGGLIDSIGNFGQNIGNLFGRKKDIDKDKKDTKDRGHKSKFLHPRSKIIFDRLVKGGMTRVAAGGILANIGVETGYTYDPGQLQHEGGPGRGLVQWEKGGRYDTDPINLVDFAKKRKKPWNDLTTQVDFILHELKDHPEYKKVRVKLNSQKDIRKATEIFLLDYEKAGEPHLDRRYEVADEIIKEGYLKAPPKVKPKPKSIFENLGLPRFHAGGGVTNNLSQGLSKLSHDGYVEENSGIKNPHSASDPVAAFLDPGEFVLTARALEGLGGVQHIENLVAKIDPNSEAASKKGSLEFRNSQPQKMQAGGIVGKKFIPKISSKNEVNDSRDHSLDYMKYFSGENIIDPNKLKKTIVEILSTEKEFKDCFCPNPIQKPEIRPYDRKPKVTTLPPIESKNGNMAGLIGKQGSKGGKSDPKPIPSFSAVSPVNDRDLNAKVYYGIE